MCDIFTSIYKYTHTYIYIYTCTTCSIDLVVRQALNQDALALSCWTISAYAWAHTDTNTHTHIHSPPSCRILKRSCSQCPALNMGLQSWAGLAELFLAKATRIHDFKAATKGRRTRGSPVNSCMSAGMDANIHLDWHRHMCTVCTIYTHR